MRGLGRSAYARGTRSPCGCDVAYFHESTKASVSNTDKCTLRHVPLGIPSARLELGAITIQFTSVVHISCILGSIRKASVLIIYFNECNRVCYLYKGLPPRRRLAALALFGAGERVRAFQVASERVLLLDLVDPDLSAMTAVSMMLHASFRTDLRSSFQM